MRFDKDGNKIHEPTCQFNKFVLCGLDNLNPQHCEKCGWNPKVAEMRLEKIKKERNMI